MALFRYRLLASLTGCWALVAGTQACVAANTSPYKASDMRPAVFEWNGTYGGLLFAVKSFKAGVPGLSATPDTVDGSGRLAGIVAGYNTKQNRWVYGLEADIGYGQIHGFSGRARIEADLMGTVRARLGHSFDGNLLYGTAGVLFAGVSQTSALMVKGDTSTHIGLIVGGGIEHALARTLTGRIEYLYGHNLQDKGVGIRHLHMIRAGAVYHLPK